MKDEGVLVVTVPYYSNKQDEPEYHVRVHTPKTLQRLLSYCGFKIEEHFCRGLMVCLSDKNIFTRLLIYLPLLFLVIFFGAEKGRKKYRYFCFSIENFIGRNKYLNFVHKFTTSYGGIMKIKKSKRTNFNKIQIESFSNK